MNRIGGMWGQGFGPAADLSVGASYGIESKAIKLNRIKQETRS